MEKVKICLIGCGRAGMIHARNYAFKIPEAQLIAICDPVEESVRSAQAQMDVKYVYTDYREALANEEIDAVIVVTPTKFHRDIVIAAAEAGKHVFCEKPMADSEQECDEMIEACRKAGVKLQLGFMRRFDKNFRRGKEIIESGVLGRVTLLKSNTYGPSEPKEWMYNVHQSYGPIGEVNSHDFDTLRWYAGSEVKRIHAIGHNFRSPEKVKEYPEYYDTCAILLEFYNGVLGMITGAQYVKYGYDSRAEILGTEGIAKIGTQHADDVEITISNRTNVSDSVPSWRTLFVDAYEAEDRSFVNCILQGTDPEVTGHDGKMALTLVNAGLKSILEHRPIDLETEQHGE